MLESCSFKDSNEETTKIPCYHNNGLDFIEVEIIKLNTESKGEPTISQLTKLSRQSMSTIQKLQEAHIRLGHVHFDAVVKMSKKGMLENIPVIDKAIPMVCKACFQNNRKRLPRNPTDHSRPPFMTRFSIDYMFYSHASLRGHNSAFTIVDQGSRYPFAFPCCAKCPPIAIMRFFVGCMTNMGFKPTVFKMDEGGELCKSTEFCKALMEMNLIVHSTGGDNKTSNGLVERFHQTLHSMNRSSLDTLKSILPSPFPKGISIQNFWDLCLGYMVQIKRIVINSTLGNSPYFPRLGLLVKLSPTRRINLYLHLDQDISWGKETIQERSSFGHRSTLIKSSGHIM